MKCIEKLLQGAEVEWHILGDVAEYIRGITYNKSAEIDKGDGWKVLRANNIILTSRKLVLDDIKLINKDIRVRDKQHLYKNDILICAGSGSKEHIGKSAYIDEDIDYVFGGFMGVVRTKRSILNSRYLFHYLGSSAFYLYLEKTLNSSTINNVSSSIMNLFPIPIPPLSVQEEIVRILDKFTTLEAELEAELDCRKRQYEYYRNQLLSFDMLKRGGQKLNNIEMMTLGEMCSVQRGKRLTKRDLNHNGRYPVFHGGIEPIGYYSSSNREANSVMVINVGASAGTVGYSSKEFWSSDGCFCFSHCEQLNQKYLFYALQSMENSIKGQVRKAGIPTLDNKVVEKLKIPIPPLAEQQRIVSILDKFEALTTSISEGLPKEIALRRKQYEYYRNQLLSFA